MKKYKQTIIPEASTEAWVKLKRNEVSVKAYEEYRTRYLSKKVVNQHLGITIGFEHEGARKMSHGGTVYSKKACLIMVLDQLVRYAEYSNWGNPKPTDPYYVIGFLNFKAKVRIDGKIEHVHLVVRVRKDGKFRCSFHYSLEVNKKNRQVLDP